MKLNVFEKKYLHIIVILLIFTSVGVGIYFITKNKPNGKLSGESIINDTCRCGLKPDGTCCKELDCRNCRS